MGKRPEGESRADRAARQRERRMTDVERTAATQDMASALAADLRAVYGQQPKRRLNPLKKAMPAARAAK